MEDGAGRVRMFRGGLRPSRRGFRRFLAGVSFGWRKFAGVLFRFPLLQDGWRLSLARFGLARMTGIGLMPALNIRTGAGRRSRAFRRRGGTRCAA